MRLIEQARRGMRSVLRGGGGGNGYGFGSWRSAFASADGFDWNREAGLRYDNGIVFAGIMCAINAMTEVDIYVRRPNGDGTFREIPNHPATLVLKNPTPWCDFPTIMGGWVISELAGRSGQSYTYKHRSSAGRVIGLEYIPHFSIYPYTSPGSDNFIDSFKLTLRTGVQNIPIEDVLRQRFGPINPLDPRVSIGPIEAVLQELCTDKQAANYTASLLKNVGVTPQLVSPMSKGIQDDSGNLFSKAEADQIMSIMEERISGSNRGLPLVMPFPIDVQNLSFNPSDMNLEAIRNVSEERICAVLGIPPICLQLGTGLENSNNRASAEAAAKALARSFTKPYMRKKALQLTNDLIPELGEPGEEIVFRVEAIEGLQEDKTETADRDETACGGAWETVNEVRQRRGLKPLPGGDVLRTKSGSSKKEKPEDTEDSDSK